MRTLLLTILAASAVMAHGEWDATWEDLGMESTVAYCITWDDAGGRMLVGTYQGFHYMDIAGGGWTVVEESGMMGREVYCIDAGSTVPEIIITGRANGFDKGYIDVSFDLGQNWDYYFSSTGGAFWDLQEDVNAPGTFYCGAISDIEPGDLLKTEDNGQTWSSLDKPQSAVTDITQSLDGTIYTCGVPAVYRSTDGGASWTEASGGLSSSTIFYSIAASPLMPGTLVCSDQQGIYRTTDGGAVWTKVDDRCCMEMEFCPGNPDRIAAVTLDGEVIGSTDGGETWFDITGDLPGYPTDLAFCGDDYQLYVATMYDGTYRTPSGFTGIGSGEGTVSGMTLAVHPNPVTSASAVNWSVPAGGIARLDVFDLTGRLVATLVDGQIPGGTHQTLLQASETGPGVLFVRLTTAEGSLVQKVLVAD